MEIQLANLALRSVIPTALGPGAAARERLLSSPKFGIGSPSRAVSAVHRAGCPGVSQIPRRSEGWNDEAGGLRPVIATC